MQTDRYTRLLLTVIAAALVANLFRGADFIPLAQAAPAQTMRCEIVGDVEIKGKIELDTFSKPVRVKMDDRIQLDQPVRIKNER